VLPTQHLTTPSSPSLTPQLEECWQRSDMAPSISLFERKFLAGCLKASKEQLGARSRGAAATPSLAF